MCHSRDVFYSSYVMISEERVKQIVREHVYKEILNFELHQFQLLFADIWCASFKKQNASEIGILDIR